MEKYLKTDRWIKEYGGQEKVSELRHELNRVHDVLYKFSGKKFNTILNSPELWKIICKHSELIKEPEDNNKGYRFK